MVPYFSAQKSIIFSIMVPLFTTFSGGLGLPSHNRFCLCSILEGTDPSPPHSLVKTKVTCVLYIVECLRNMGPGSPYHCWKPLKD